MAPEVGIEPTTQWLHGSQCFQRGWTISSPLVKGREALPIPPRRGTVLPSGIVSEPYPTDRRILAADYRIPQCETYRLPAIHLIFRPCFRREAAFNFLCPTATCSTAELLGSDEIAPSMEQKVLFFLHHANLPCDKCVRTRVKKSLLFAEKNARNIGTFAQFGK